MSLIYIVLLTIAALAISAIGAVFSIVGLTSLFAGAVLAVGIMAGSLEFAKLVTAGFLYRYWGHINATMRFYLAFAVVILSLVTSMGIFGYLSNAYQKSALEYKTLNLKVEALKKKDTLAKEEMARIEGFINAIPATRITKKLEVREDYRYDLADLRDISTQANQEIEKLKLEMLTSQTEIGPVLYVAEATGFHVDTIAKILILLFVSVFDPLALCLVFALSLAIRLREKYRGDEQRIGRLALTKPVDHRYRSAS
jgi:hypothetical protein